MGLDARTIMDNRAIDLRLEEPRFIISTRAACHISPERSDFTTLTPIIPRPVEGLAGGCAYAMGRGTIVIHTDISAGHKLTLQDALFVPFSPVRLISVGALCHDDIYSCFFRPDSCGITDQSGTTVAHITKSLRYPYVLSTRAPIVTHSD